MLGFDLFARYIQPARRYREKDQVDRITEHHPFDDQGLKKPLQPDRGMNRENETFESQNITVKKMGEEGMNLITGNLIKGNQQDDRVKGREETNHRIVHFPANQDAGDRKGHAAKINQ